MTIPLVNLDSALPLVPLGIPLTVLVGWRDAPESRPRWRTTLSGEWREEVVETVVKRET
jgi:hypothetical protein